MSETKNKVKEYLSIVISVIAILAAIGSFANTKAKTAVFEYKVEQNEIHIKTLEIKTENIPVMQNDVKNLAKEVGEVKVIVQGISDYLIKN